MDAKSVDFVGRLFVVGLDRRASRAGRNDADDCGAPGGRALPTTG